MGKDEVFIGCFGVKLVYTPLLLTSQALFLTISYQRHSFRASTNYNEVNVFKDCFNEINNSYTFLLL